MAEVGVRSRLLGGIGVLCLGVSWTVRLAPEIADALFLSSFGKFTLLGILLAAVLLPIVAALTGSKWWLVVTAASGIILADFYIHLSRLAR
jgi:hypothetical protein